MKTNSEIASDFDGIAAALAARPARSRLTPSERALLRHVPPGARTAIDVGCGDGVVARALAQRGLHVTALDLSPSMIALASANTPTTLSVAYATTDAMSAALPNGGFDVVVSINMVHHLVLSAVVSRLAKLVAPGGVLLIQDVVTRTGFRYLLPNIVGGIQQRFQRIRAGSRSRVIGALYERHGEGETYLTPAEADAVYPTLLPGVHLEHHTDWRYSAIWTNSDDPPSR